MTKIEVPLLDNLPPIFADCVAEESTRYAITEPWVRDGFAYATDGRIAVRMECDAPDTPDSEDSHFPDASSLGWGPERFEDKPIGLPTDPPIEHCNQCHGDGYVTCSDPKCQTERECENCRGSGGERMQIAQSGVHGVWIAERYWRLLQRHGAHVFLCKNDPYKSAIRFITGKVEGLLMPIEKRNDA